jgi:hypothetical protein
MEESPKRAIGSKLEMTYVAPINASLRDALRIAQRFIGESL